MKEFKMEEEVLKFINGDSYEGDFKNGLFHGQGTGFSNGDKYMDSMKMMYPMEKEPKYSIMETNILVILNLVQEMGKEF